MARGDRLRVQRRLLGAAVTYMHHGIDIGDGTVVHARPDDFRNPFAGGRVERTTREAFAGGAEVIITTQPPARFSAHEIVHRALAYVGRPGYCPVIDNCEHFATWCATGARASRQVDIVLQRVAGLAARIATATSSRVLARAALGTTLRTGMRALVPAAIAAEAAALAAEWTAHHAGRSAADSRLAGEAVGAATSAAALAAAAAATGPGGMLAAAVAGCAFWTGSSLAAAAAARNYCRSRHG